VLMLLQLALHTGEVHISAQDGLHLPEQDANLQCRAMKISQTERLMLLLRSQWEVSLGHIPSLILQSPGFVQH
jgi:hypothetical protein